VSSANDDLQPAASVGDFVFHDLNANGIQDTGERRVGGVTVTLTGGGCGRVDQRRGDTTATTTTDGSGSVIQFTNLNPGERGVPVRFTQPAAYVSSPRPTRRATRPRNSDAKPRGA